MIQRVEKKITKIIRYPHTHPQSSVKYLKGVDVIKNLVNTSNFVKKLYQKI